MSSTNGHGFVDKHTLDVSGGAGGQVGAATLNSAVQKAAGANKNIFTLVIMHSEVATNLENMKLLDYAKGTDAEGIQKDMTLATWNGRTVLIDDNVPTEEDSTSGKTKYTTYILGKNAFDYCDCGVKVPTEVARDAATAGGIDKLYTRQRKLYAPHGISFVQPSTAIVSPTNEQLATGARWQLVKSTTGEWYNDAAIPIARILSFG